MSNFITLQDYDASIHRDILDALIREDETIIEIVEDRAVSEMKGYLARRYDTEAIFSATGDTRNQLVLMLALDMTIYHIFCIHNPLKLSAMRKERYERAIDFLKYVARGKANIDAAPLLPEDELLKKSSFIAKSNPKRINHY